jgi:hypothetical protein
MYSLGIIPRRSACPADESGNPPVSVTGPLIDQSADFRGQALISLPL